MIALLGYSASGKSTIERELVKQYKMNKIVSYTTRPPRLGEFDGEDYHFISEQEFLKRKSVGYFAETTSYNTVYGIWHYGTALKDITDDKVCVINPEGLRQLKQHNLNITSFYIDIDEVTIIDRLKKRGDNEEEYMSRLERDRLDFANIHNEVDFVIGNNKNQLTPLEMTSIVYLLSKAKVVSNE
jgi:guanylate kinase